MRAGGSNVHQRTATTQGAGEGDGLGERVFGQRGADVVALAMQQ